MHIEQVILQLNQMRLTTMAASLRSRIDSGDTIGLPPEEFVALLVEDEYLARTNRKLQRMINQANFKPEQACIENLDYRPSRGLAKPEVLQLTTAKWINNAENVVITGPTGVGKTYLAEAIGLQACRIGFPAMKIRYRMLFENIKTARGTGQYLKYLKRMARIKVLIIDDFLMQNISQQEAGDLVDIVEDRQQCSSLIITTQYPVNEWHKKLPDPSIADALCDRIVHTARKFNLKGESLRKRTKIRSK